MVRILGIETSCDETAIGIVEDGTTILANVVASSQEFHRPYGGVIPDIAARVHVEVIWPVLETALSEASCALEQIDAIAVTQGPGLPGALLIGVAFAKGLALSLDRPLIGVDHLAAHLHVGRMVEPSLEAPYLGLVVSGGHTLLCIAHEEQRFELLGETKDDAVGEAFDKVAKLLGLGYPGGPAIDRLSDEGDPKAVNFPRHLAKEGFDFSFSGLKTAVYHYVEKTMGSTARRLDSNKSDEPTSRRADEPSGLFRQQVADIAASFQETIVEMLMAKTVRAAQRTGMRRLVLGGGVAANRRLAQRMKEEGQARGWQVVVPPPRLCVDNGAMVAGVGFEQLRRGAVSPWSMNANPHLRLTDVVTTLS